MPRPIRQMPYPYALMEVSIRTVQSRFLLRPSAELDELILGILGRALFLYLKEDIERDTWHEAVDESSGFLGVDGVLRQEPHGKPNKTKRSRAPLCYASKSTVRKAYEKLYRKFVSVYRQAMERFEQGEVDVKFPAGCFLPPVVCPVSMTYATAPG